MTIKNRRQTKIAINRMQWLDRYRLHDKWRIFVTAYVETRNATKSAARAGYKNPGVQGHRLLKNAKIRSAIDDGIAEIGDRAMTRAEDVLCQWAEIATADPNDLVQHIHAPCRYCHGVDHEYQWTTDREYREALKVAACDIFGGDAEQIQTAIDGLTNDPRLPDNVGGYGYCATDAPDPNCPECAGLGVSHVRIADTRHLSDAARLLYDGIEETKQGRKVKIRDRDHALDSLAKHLGMFAGKVEDETTNPLTRLAERAMVAAQPVPVAAAPPFAAHRMTGTRCRQDDEGSLKP